MGTVLSPIIDLSAWEETRTDGMNALSLSTKKKVDQTVPRSRHDDEI